MQKENLAVVQEKLKKERVIGIIKSFGNFFYRDGGLRDNGWKLRSINAKLNSNEKLEDLVFETNDIFSDTYFQIINNLGENVSRLKVVAVLPVTDNLVSISMDLNTDCVRLETEISGQLNNNFNICGDVFRSILVEANEWRDIYGGFLEIPEHIVDINPREMSSKYDSATIKF